VVCAVGGELADRLHTEDGGKKLLSEQATKWGPSGIDIGPNAV